MVSTFAGSLEPPTKTSTGRRDLLVLRGLATISLFATDVAAARDWYAELLGVEAYFVRETTGVPVYVEFRLGDYQHELGIIDRRFGPDGAAGPQARGGVIAYWHVDDVRACLARLLDAGATMHEQVTERGPGFVTASVVDPFGNVLGVMKNQHYLDVLGSRTMT